MKKHNKILLAFLLNLFFSVFEFFGGIISGSVAIASDALHDLGDALSIGISYFLEKLSRKKPDSSYTYGYIRFSLLGSVLQSGILLLGSLIIVVRAAKRIVNPTPINYNEMLVFAVAGLLINLIAAFITAGKGSLNQRAAHLHMLEDTLGWATVLLGAVIMRFTDFWLLDPALSIALAVFIGINAAKALAEVVRIFLLKVPSDVSTQEIKEHLLEIEGVLDIHHLHINSLDGNRHVATLHAVIAGDAAKIKAQIREELAEHSVIHAVIETESERDCCENSECTAYAELESEHSHHHHHHHHHH